VDAEELPEELISGARSGGLDGCRSGWIFCSFASGRFAWNYLAGLGGLRDVAERDAVILADVPIGLPHRGDPARRCDRLARRELGTRASSVFSPPSAEALGERTYRDALAANRRVTGKGISLQSWNIAPKIREALECQGSPKLRESHPEVCFRRLRGRSARHSKKTPAGRDERFELLCSLDRAARSSLAKSRERIGRSIAAVDDFLDAAILAAAATGEIEPLPARPCKGEPVIWAPNSRDEPNRSIDPAYHHLNNPAF